MAATLTMEGVANIFSKCQQKDEYEKEIHQLTKIFKKTDFKTFCASFFHCLKICLTVKHNAPVVKRALTFVAKFIFSVNENEVQPSNKENVDENREVNGETAHMSKLMSKLWGLILKNCEASSVEVRLNLCYLVATLLNLLGEDAAIDLELYVMLQKSMMNMLKDRNSLVRTEVISALKPLQDVVDDDCPVVKAFLFHLVNDPCPDVRREIVNEIGLSKLTISKLISRIRDVKENIRIAAFKRLSLIYMNSLSIAKRIEILKIGLNDRSEKVRKTCVDSLLTAWFKHSKDFLTFLKRLDVIEESDTAKLALNMLFETMELNDAIEGFNLLDEHRIIRQEVLDVESVFYWRVLCEYVDRHPDGKKDGSLEKILPNFSLLLDLIMKLVIESLEDADYMKQLENTFICQQLILISLLYEFVDECERRRGCELVKRILLSNSVNEFIVRNTIKLLAKVMPNQSNRFNFLSEIISEIRVKVDKIEETLDPEKIRQITLKVAQLKVEINITRDEMETLVSKQIFDGAQSKKERLEKLENALAELTATLQPQIREICEIKDDSVTVLKCLSILCVIMEGKLSQLPTPSLLSYMDDIILPSVKSVDDSVRKLAVKALGLGCTSNDDLAASNFLLLVEICKFDEEEVRIIAIKAVFDIILCHGFNMFNSLEGSSRDASDNQDSVEIQKEAEPQHASKMLNKLLKIFLELLDSGFPEVHTVVCEGFCKWLKSRRLMSTKIVSRLIIMWYNPITEDNYRLRSVVGVFFQTFASDRFNQELLEAAFLPTLNILFDAPKSSPLYKVNALDVAKFIVELLRPLYGHQSSSNKDPSFHDKLAITICKEILQDPYSCQVSVLTKTLKSLQISANSEVINELDELCVEVKEVFEDNRINAAPLIAFHKDVKNIKLGLSDVSCSHPEERASESPDIDGDDDEVGSTESDVNNDEE